MAKPTEDKEDKNLDKKIELNSNTMLMVNNAVMIIVIVVSMIVMYVLLDHSFTKKIEKFAPQQEEEISEEEDEARQEGILLDLGEFILNLADTTHRRYLKVGLAMELSKTEEEILAAANAQNTKSSGGHGHSEAPAADSSALIVAEMERYKPAIRDAVISVLSNKTSDELATPTGKEIAKEEILEMVNNIFEGQREVMRVSFGQFVIQ